ncbi:MAG TPA: PIN domain-containing protein [Solirubrobacterales bacterium]|nr:PIN domain-containing protein [Solirubrobacterales bacterium]
MSTADPSLTGSLLVDNSAFSRLQQSNLPPDRAAEVRMAMRERRLFVCLPFLLEAGYSARNHREHVTLIDGLRALPAAALDADSESRALAAQRQLAALGHHRLPPPDLILAALAEANGTGVLHYDRDFDLIAEHTDLRFESVWLASAGSL